MHNVSAQRRAIFKRFLIKKTKNNYPLNGENMTSYFNKTIKKQTSYESKY